MKKQEAYNDKIKGYTELTEDELDQVNGGAFGQHGYGQFQTMEGRGKQHGRAVTMENRYGQNDRFAIFEGMTTADIQGILPTAPNYLLAQEWLRQTNNNNRNGGNGGGFAM